MCGIVELLHPGPIFQNLAGLGTVRRSDDAVLLHKVDQARGPPVPDSQAALQRGSGSAAGIANHADGVLVEIVVDILAALGIAFGRSLGLAVLILRRREELFLVLRLGLLTPEVAYGADLIFRHSLAVESMEPPRPRAEVPARRRSQHGRPTLRP